MDREEELKRLELEYLRNYQKLRDGLPHRHKFKWYKWAREFYESTAKYNFICASNQSTKSSTQIRKCIEWAVNKKLWPELWKHEPRVFWYLYPSQDIVDTEVKKKWVPDFLPNGEYKDDPEFGWKWELHNGRHVAAIHFNSGVSIYFKSYMQNVTVMQATTVDAIFVDEELPEELFPELRFRIAATNGYFHGVFTATLGQEYWRMIIEEPANKKPLKNARTWQVSMYDLLEYEDGTKSHWTVERIEEEKRACPTEKEILRRVYGRFVKADDLRYPAFERTKNVIPKTVIPNDWLIYGGVDIGSGGVGKSHPSAISFVAVRPDFRLGVVFRGWRGDGVITTAGDTFMKYLELRRGLRCAAQYYDYASKDFGTVAHRNNEPFSTADKRVEFGDGILNTLFKNRMLLIHDIPELYPLIVELENLSAGVKKYATKQRDDYCFVAGTKVETINGPKNIEDIAMGDLVMTSKGFHPVIGLGNRVEEVVKVDFEDGNQLVCTDDHPFFVFDGWKKSSSLTQFDTVFKFDRWEKGYASFSTGLNSVNTPSQNSSRIENIIDQVVTTLSAAFSIYTKKFGSFTTGLYQRGMLFITLMKILRTTLFPTSWQYPTKTMYLLTCVNTSEGTKTKNIGASGLRKCKMPPLSGMVLWQPGSFMYALEGLLGGAGSLITGSVLYATNAMEQRLLDQQNFVLEHAERGLYGHAVGVKALSPFGRALVYNLKVAKVPEYFANGILVHNCDSLRYCIASIPWDFTAVVQGVDMQLIAAPEKREVDERRSFVLGDDVELGEGLLEADISFWQEYIEA